jgi:polysaccharide biosynthesis/export protein
MPITAIDIPVTMETNNMPSLLRASALPSLLVFTCLCVSTSPSLAQTESLLVGPGDLVHVLVYDTPEMEQQVRVSDAGMIALAYVGNVKVAGLSPFAAGHLVEQTLIQKEIMRHPQVTFTVDQYATQNVSIMGQVQTPGVYPITTALPVLKVLSLANGLTDLADRNIVIQRHSDPTQRVTYRLSNDGNEAFANSVLVYPGDTVLVSKVDLIYVLGDVAKPGGYPISNNDSKITVLQAISLAGSTNKTAQTSNVRLIRKGGNGQQDTIIHLSAIQKGKETDQPLMPEDILYVPFSWMKNFGMSASTIASQTGSAAIYVAR